MSVAEKKYKVNFTYLLNNLLLIYYIAEKYSEGLSEKEIASNLDCSLDTVKRFLSLLHKISTEKHYTRYYQKKKAEDELTDKA